MSQPKRIQRSRAKGWKMPANTVYVGRGSKYGNPFKVGQVAQHPINYLGKVYVRDNHHAMVLFDNWLVLHARHLQLDAKRDLRGKDLACWCGPEESCHADVLLKLANRVEKKAA